jgi:hypothetical protein
MAVSAGACGGESFAAAAPEAPADASTVDAADASNGDAASTGIALADLPPKFAAALCTSYEACVGKDVVNLFMNGQSCADRTQPAITNGTFPLFQSKIGAGKMAYDPLKAQACLNAIAARTCAQMNDRDPPECLAAFDGTVALGGASTLDEECKGSAICQSTTGTCPGTCVGLLAAGQACTKDGDCASGLQCSTETKLCVQPAGADQKCEWGQPPCGPGLVCLGKNDTAMTPGTCKSPAQAFAADEGAACDLAKGQLCKTGLSCAVLNATLQCVKAGSYAAGTACRVAVPDACAAGNYCKSSGLLQPFDGTCTGLLQAGAACDPKASRCQTGAVCAAGKCQNLAANGVSCTADEMCYSENCASAGCEAKLPCK